MERRVRAVPFKIRDVTAIAGDLFSDGFGHRE
jgi:hypothetical protein